MIIGVALILGLIGAFWAQSKNLNPFLWGVLCTLLPVLGLLILAFRKAQQPLEQKIATAIKSSRATPQTDQRFDQQKWNALVQYDPDIKRAYDYVVPLGPTYVQRLATDYFALNDKAYLPQIVNKLVAEYNADLTDDRVVNIGDSRPFSEGVLGDVKWAYFEDGSYVGERAGLRKKFRSFEDLQAFYQI
jgi:hypothetical protein